MVQKDIGFDYDAEEDNLFLFRRGVKSKGGILAGDVIVDMNHRGLVKGIEFLNATKTLGIMANKKLSKEVLANIKYANLRTVISKNNIVYVNFSLISVSKFKEEAINSYISLPQKVICG